MNGVKQMPFDGKSFLYTFNHPNAPSVRHTQYFDIVDNIGFYHDGWIAATTPIAWPWQNQFKQHEVPLNHRTWELYHVNNDYSEDKNLASEYPRKLKDLQDEFLKVALENNVLPIHSRAQGGAGRPMPPGTQEDSTTFYPGMPAVYMGSFERAGNQAFVITADVDIPSGGATGVIANRGSRFVGYSFYMANDHLAFCFNAVPPWITTVTSSEQVPAGHHVLSAEFIPGHGKPGSGGTVVLKMDGKTIGQGQVNHVPLDYWEDDYFMIGESVPTPVSPDYKVPAKFTGKLESVNLTYK